RVVRSCGVGRPASGAVPEVPDRSQAGIFRTRDLRPERSGKIEPERSFEPAGAVTPFSGGVLPCVTSGGVDERAVPLFLSVVTNELPRDSPDLTSALPPGTGGLAGNLSFDVPSSPRTMALAPVPATFSMLPRITGTPSLPRPTMYRISMWGL